MIHFVDNPAVLLLDFGALADDHAESGNQRGSIPFGSFLVMQRAKRSSG